MRTFLPALTLTALCLVGTLHAGGFDKITDQVWAIKEDPAKGWKGAVVLEHRTSFHNTYVEYLYRVRIFDEKGRSAAEIAEFSEDAYDIEGRTVYPDGKVTPFNKRKDLTSKSVSLGDYEGKTTVLIPPGVTADCVVEVRWKESAWGRELPLPRHMGLSESFRVGGPFFTLEHVFEVPVPFGFAYQVFPTRTLVPEMKEKGQYRTFTWRNVPARASLPFALDVTREIPNFTTYYVPDLLRFAARENGASFWKQAINVYFKPFFESEIKKGKAYRALSDDLRKGLQGSPLEQATQLMTRLDARIRNTTFATFEEKAAVTKKQAEDDFDSHDLEEAARRGNTDSRGMTLLFYHLLKEQGLQPKIALVADRDRRLFIYDFTNVFQFTSHLLVVEGADKSAVWIEPARRFLKPGVIHQDYQGTPALIIDPKDWTSSKTVIMAQPAGVNVRHYAVDVRPEEGSDLFSVQASFSGFSEYVERSQFMSLEPKEQTRTLKESTERWMKNAALTKVEVKGAQDPAAKLTWTIEGNIDREDGRQRTVDPFPTVPLAIHIPDEWPSDRKDPIVVSHRRVHEAQSTIHLPKDWTWNGTDSYDHQNRFGTVHWSAQKKEDGTVRVELKIEINTLFEAPTAYEELKTFLGWVREASGRTLVLSKARG